MTESHGVLVRVRAGIDVVTNEATWELQSIDPETGGKCVCMCIHLRYIIKLGQIKKQIASQQKELKHIA